MTTIIDKHGARREALPGETLEDGERLLVQLHLMDGGSPPVLFDGSLAGHRPGFVFSADTRAREAREAAREAMKRRLCDAWRGPGNERATAVRDANEVYASYARRLTDAWRSA